jgi:hypothetical protein
MIIDTTMTEIARPYLSPWEYWNKEYPCYALYYQVCVSVGTGEIIHFAGPFKGAAADITIARQTIIYIYIYRVRQNCRKINFTDETICTCYSLVAIFMETAPTMHDCTSKISKLHSQKTPT